MSAIFHYPGCPAVAGNASACACTYQHMTFKPTDPPTLQIDPATQNEHGVHREILRSVFALLQEDGHQWSSRPCSTCQTISNLTGIQFGCIEYAARKRQAMKKDV